MKTFDVWLEGDEEPCPMDGQRYVSSDAESAAKALIEEFYDLAPGDGAIDVLAREVGGVEMLRIRVFVTRTLRTELLS